MSRLSRLVVLLGLLSACATEPPSVAESDAPRRPNIVLLLADDAGYADFGFQPVSEPDVAVLTPHIDSIAADGARFSDFYMSGAVCSPSRAGLLTGRYQDRFGHGRNIPPGYMGGGLSLEEVTVADRLRAAGYVTGCVGKWHLGYPEEYHPLKRGFDEFYGLLQGSRSYYPMEDPSPHKAIFEDREETAEEGYVTDRFGAAAVRFIEEHKAEPFFLFVSFTAPHGPLQAKPEDLELPALREIEDDRRRKYAGLVKALDDNVGEILAALERERLAEETLVIFTNDNGGQTSTGALNSPLRGRKGTMWEGGVRVPCAMRWPGVLAAGGVIEAPSIALDLTPTFCALAGEPALDEAALDGVDLTPLLHGMESSPQPRSFFWRKTGSAGPIAVRRGRWKLVWEERDASPELYDLQTDLSESLDLAASQPELAEELLAELVAWEAQLIEPLWGR